MTVYRDVPIETLTEKYGTIYADCPWGFLTRQKKLSIPQRHEVQHYAPMTMNELMALPVASVAAKDVVLHMWTISSHVQLCIKVAEEWGFEFKSFGWNWIKTQRGDPDAPKMSMGFWVRQESEIALLFTRGKPTRLDKGVRQVHFEPAGLHSRKPEEFMRRTERLSAGPYLEMFSRSDRPSWDSWGSEAGKFSHSEWHAVREAPLYEVSRDGQVRRIGANDPLVPYDCEGYEKVDLHLGDGSRLERFVHRLVAQAFIPNPDNLPFVDHKDRSRKNNWEDNLRWTDAPRNGANSAHHNEYRGVTEYESGFKAFGSDAGKTIYLGSFLTAVGAAHAYDDYAKEKYGAFAVLNFPNGKFVSRGKGKIDLDDLI